jgi:small subunit ribosomal protein S1
MSDKKRRRINDSSAQAANKVELVETVQNPNNQEEVKVETKIEDDGPDFLLPDGEFDWDAFEATCPTRTRKANPHIKTKNGDKVFSRESYAQELYDLMEGTNACDIIPQLFIGEIHEGIIYAVDQEYITVDIKYRELVYIKAGKESEEVRQMLPGQETSVLITETKGTLTGTITGGVKHKTFMDLRDAIEGGNTAWIGTVNNMIENGGYIVKVQGVDCFMPGSLAGINKLSDFSSIVGEELYVVPVSFSPERGTLVVSHRKYLQALIPTAINELKETLDEPKHGLVTGTAKYGVFVEFNKCLTGMIHTNELDEATSVKFKAREIKPGEPIEFFVKDIITNNKITLTQKENTSVNPWINISTRYSIPSVVKAKIKTKKEYGVFVNIEDGVTGLLHISELPGDILDTYRVGDDIEVQITRIDEDSMKVFLKLPQ